MDPVKRSITGHSMGGHGAMVAHLKNPGMYTSVSAFCPIANPTAVPWGEKVKCTSRDIQSVDMSLGTLTVIMI